jgi:hypothetical protein
MASTWPVNDPGDAGSGSCVTTCTLRDAIANAAPGDTVAFALAFPATIQWNGLPLLIYKSLVITGPGPDQLTLSAARRSRVIEIANGATVTIRGLAIADGTAAPGSRAIRPRVRDCRRQYRDRRLFARGPSSFRNRRRI